MLSSDINLVVFMTAIAGVALQAGGMASLARTGAALAVVDREGVRLVELRRGPGRYRMAGGAVAGEQPGMHVRLLVAAGALLRGALVLAVDMTLLTGDIDVSAFQLEGRF